METALGGVIAAARLPRHVPLYVVILMTVVYLLLIHETSERPSLSFAGHGVVAGAMFAGACVVFCLVMLIRVPSLPLRGAVRVAGRHSYGIYLFHGLIFKVFEEVGVLQRPETPWHGILIFVVAAPIGLFALALFEMTVNEFVFGKRSIRNAFVMGRATAMELVLRTRRSGSAD